MNVSELLENYKGTIVFLDNSTQKEVCTAPGGSPIISELQDFEVLGWSSIKSSTNPKVAVVCQFTSVPPVEPEVENTEVE